MAALSVRNYQSDLLGRDRAEKFVEQFSLNRRRPLHAETVRQAPASDFASEAVGDAALADALGTVQWTDLDRDLRQTWLESLGHVDEELRIARDLTREAVATRPGWPYHWFRLGALDYAAKSRRLKSELFSSPRSWIAPLELAARAAPGSDDIVTFLAAAYLETWSEISPAARANAPAVFRRAFLNADFVSRGFLPAVGMLGREAAVRLLPEAGRPLRVAFTLLSRGGDAEGAALLSDRLERSERRERASALRNIENRHRFGDTYGLREACIHWAAAYPVEDYDRPEERAQAARVLELWPHDTAGSWLTDRRGDFVRFFLSGRELHANGEAVGRAVGALSGVPETVRARAMLLEGDHYGAQALARRSGAAGSFEWTPFFVALAREELARRRPREARAALEKLAPAAREECDTLLARREVARSLRDAFELETVNQALLRRHADSFPEEAWSASGTLSLCLDPDETRGRVLIVSLAATEPAFVDYGWDGGRWGSLFLQDSATLRVPLSGLSGSRAFSVSAIAGGPISATGALRGNPERGQYE